uniref:Uncharacterized protein n=1 Tax=Lepeophtheirus salmonis TaxID=72036 RepID=A0A0K2THY8_LEPSM
MSFLINNDPNKVDNISLLSEHDRKRQSSKMGGKRL